MGKSSEYNHYMQELDALGNVTSQDWEDIEEKFPGLRYLKATGINDIGKAKNIYTEEYAESDRKRVYLPNDGKYANEGTEISMTFIIIGNQTDRLATLTQFTNYVRKGVHRYYDTARQRVFDFVVINEIKVSDEKWHGGSPYIEVVVPMQNLNGSTQPYTQGI